MKKDKTIFVKDLNGNFFDISSIGIVTDEVVTDESGKKFELKAANFEQIQSSSSLSPSLEGKTDETGNAMIRNIVNSNGENIDLGTITDSSDIPKEIFVIIEATHSGKNDNYGIYTESSLSEDYKTFTKDFDKPLIKNHDVHSEPLGRVIESSFTRSIIDEEKMAVLVKVKVTDSDAIVKFLDGRYRTVSIGASAQEITCSVCNAKIYQDGKVNFCGHWRGEVYNIKNDDSESKIKEAKEVTCYWIAEQLHFKELSVVNTPADSNAQTISISKTDTSVRNDSEDTSLKNSITDLISNYSNADKNIESLLDSLDKIINVKDEKEEAKKTDEKKITDEKKSEDDKVKTKDVTDTEKVEEANKIADDKIILLDAQILSLNNNITELKKENNSLKETISDKEEKENTLIEVNSSLTDSLIGITKDYKVRIRNIALEATLASKDEAELTDEMKESITLQIDSKTLSELLTIVDNKKEIKPSVIDNKALVIDKETNGTKEKKKKRTMQDYLDNI